MTAAEARKWPQTRPTAADERYDSAMDLRSAFAKLGQKLEGDDEAPTGSPVRHEYDLAWMLEHQADELAAYADCLIKTRGLYHASKDWLGPVGLVLNDEDYETLAERVKKYETAIVHAAFRHQE